MWKIHVRDERCFLGHEIWIRLFKKKIVAEKENNCQHFLLPSVYQSTALCYHRKTEFHAGSAEENDAFKISDTVADSSVLCQSPAQVLLGFIKFIGYPFLHLFPGKSVPYGNSCPSQLAPQKWEIRQDR